MYIVAHTRSFFSRILLTKRSLQTEVKIFLWMDNCGQPREFCRWPDISVPWTFLSPPRPSHFVGSVWYCSGMATVRERVSKIGALTTPVKDTKMTGPTNNQVCRHDARAMHLSWIHRHVANFMWCHICLFVQVSLSKRGQTLIDFHVRLCLMHILERWKHDKVVSLLLSASLGAYLTHHYLLGFK